MTSEPTEMIPRHSDPDALMEGEPEDWQTSPQLLTTEIASITLCRYSGAQVPLDELCASREKRLHPDVECRTTFYSADAIERGDVVLEMTAGKVTMNAGGDVTFHDPVDQ